MNLLENLNRRYATKSFVVDKKIHQSDIDDILEAFRLSPSAFGLQPWKLIVVEDSMTREKLLEHSWGQKQVVEASHLLVLARIENPGKDLVEKYIEQVSGDTNTPKDSLAGYYEMMVGFLEKLSKEERNARADRQLFLAAGNLLSFLANKHIDSCPMEGFDSKKYNEILGLNQLGLSASMILPIGYRNENDKYATRPKVRFAKNDVVIVK